jgi:hypothetical protein
MKGNVFRSVRARGKCGKGQLIGVKPLSISDVLNEPIGIVTSVGERDPETGLTPCWVQLIGIAKATTGGGPDGMVVDYKPMGFFARIKWLARRLWRMANLW